ncbi:MAG: ABC transporter permease [Gallionella sp.]|jgi:ABC-type antimicrobial peptide transport system permease subunit
MKFLQRRNFLDGIAQAVLSLKDNRLRTMLSILGIAAGIAAVMAVGSVSQGGHHLIFKELETFGLKSVWVWRSEENPNPNRIVRTGSGIDPADVAALHSDCCPAVSRITPIIYTYGKNLTVHVGNRYSNGVVTGVGSEYLAINNDTLSAGAGFTPEDILHRRNVALIGIDVANDLFGGTTGLAGKSMRINERNYTVIGVLAAKSRALLESIGSGRNDENKRVLVPYTALQTQFGNNEIHGIQAEAVEFAQADAAVAQIISVLELQHRRQFGYHAETMSKYIATTNRILQFVSLIGVLAASISLLVGGMGIMNIVSTSVLERTREIGLRKAVGASRRHILFQFLMESVILSTVGGAIGLVAGFVISVILAWFTGFPLTPSWLTIAVALLVSVAIGLLSGYYPASRAANLRPVTALRYE